MPLSKPATVGLLVLAMVVLLVATLVGTAITSSPTAGGLFGFAAVVALLLTVAGPRGGSRALGFVAVPTSQLVGAVLVGMSMFLVINVLNTLLMPQFSTGYIENAIESPSLVLVYLSFGLGAPIAEEMLFRGMVLPGFLGLGRRFAIPISAALFAGYHIMPAQMFPAFLFGLAVGAIALRTRSIIPGILIHITNNTVVVTLALTGFAERFDDHLPLLLALSTIPLATGAYLLFRPTASSSVPALQASPTR